MPHRRLLLPALLAVLAGLLVAGPVSAAVAKRVYAIDPLSHKLKVKPHKLSFRDLEMTELRWRHWGRKLARARGISRILTCSPSCAKDDKVARATSGG